VKVRTWIETEVEVEVSVAEAMAELCDMPTVEGRQELVFVMNRCVAALKNCPDASIATLEPKPRQVIAAALREQAARYALPAAPAQEE
jgi:hypothetical protein